MAQPPSTTTTTTTTTSTPPPEPLYGGYTRFELELEFVQTLSNPHHLNHLASQKLLQDPTFIAYLDYLRYFTRPEYAKYLTYPGPTLKALDLLQQEAFREAVWRLDVVGGMVEGGMRGFMEEGRDG